MAALLFPIPSGGILHVVSPFLVVAAGLLLGCAELSGNHLGYSKFAVSNKLRVPSKAGMFWIYFPSALVSSGFLFLAYWIGIGAFLKSCGASGVATFLESKEALVAASDPRFLLVAAAVFLHFSKRCLEVLFLHKFSGDTNLGSVVFISNTCSGSCALLLFTQVKCIGLAPPSLDLKWLGLATYLVGITGNGYHHWLLSQLRKEGSKKLYVVPHGGLFGLFVCPHYVSEMAMFVGVALLSQTWVGCAMAVFVFFYLTARTIETKQWYMKKVDGFPEERRVLIPGVF